MNEIQAEKPNSQSLALTQLTDPTFIARVCAPFLAYEIQPSALSPNLVLRDIIPAMKSAIKSSKHDTMPNVNLMIRFIIDYFQQEGMSIIIKEIMPALMGALLQCDLKTIMAQHNFFTDAFSSIPAQFRDGALIAIISRHSSAPDCKIRVIVINLITMVHDFSRVKTCFQSLSFDRVPTVRVAFVNGLAYCHFEQQVIDHFIHNAVRDQAVQVRNAAAQVIGLVAPYLIDDYLLLLQNNSTAESALSSLKSIVQANSLGSVYQDFVLALSSFPEKGINALLLTAPIVHPSEHLLLIKIAEQLKDNMLFVSKLSLFASIIGNAEPFFNYLWPNDGASWRIRYQLAHQARAFIPYFKSRLISLAIMYSEDEIAQIRNESVHIWKEIIKEDPEAINNLFQLLESKWQTRLVAAKVVSGEEIMSELAQEMAKILSKDSVSNVRYCLAKNLHGTKYFDMFFSDTKDIDITGL